MFKKVEEFENKRKGAQLMLVIFVLKFSERNLKSWKCLISQEVQFKAYSFFIGEKGDNFSLRGLCIYMIILFSSYCFGFSYF